MALDGIFGALLLGTWAASILCGVVAAQTYTYFTTFPNDPWSRKGLVIVAITFTVAALVGDYANTYLPTVTYWGNEEATQKVYWPLPLYSIMNTLLAFIVDCYLIHRLYTLFNGLKVAGYLMGFIPLVRGSTYADRDKSRIGAMINFISIAVCDLCTAAGLIWKLRSMRSNFAPTNTFITRVVVGAIQTGSTTSLCSILLLVTFLNNPQSNVPTFFIFLFAPLYSLTLLFNFNLRRNPGVSGSRTSESRGGGNNNIINMDGIHVHRTAIVTMDPTDSELEAAGRRMYQHKEGYLEDLIHYRRSEIPELVYITVRQVLDLSMDVDTWEKSEQIASKSKVGGSKACCGGFRKWGLTEFANRDAGAYTSVCGRTRLQSATHDFSTPWDFSLVTTQQLAPNASPLDPNGKPMARARLFWPTRESGSRACSPKREAQNCAASFQH
ncbi:hypothetical protein B0H13DRAFT_1879827 [Mycena leptocephala]|nr:hypothetical protein B0H13DRAFT_1879827 [Mycena leptocephala]